jgi:hypothetical protein
MGIMKSHHAAVKGPSRKDGKVWRLAAVGVVVAKGNAARMRQYVKRNGGGAAGYFVYLTNREVGEEVQP